MKIKTEEETRNKISLLNDLGMRIREAREEAKMSQLQVGLALAVSDKTISGYESARISPPIDKLVQLGELFKKPIGYFLGSDPKEYTVSSRLRAVEVMMKEIKKQLDEIKLYSQVKDLQD